jgi:hypothetical protein
VTYLTERDGRYGDVAPVQKRATVWVASLVMAALSLGASWSHVLQIRGKAPWAGPFWRAAMESLYRDYAIIGGPVDILAIVVTWWLVWVVRRSGEFHWVLAAALLLTVAFVVVWVGFVAPINSVFATWTPASVPADWTDWRNRWELCHAVIAGLKLTAFTALAIAAVKGQERGGT